MLTRKLLGLATASSLAFAVVVAVLLVPAAQATAQDVVQDEGAAYRAWYEATQAKDSAKAMEAAKTYLEQYPTGQYADALKKWVDAQKLAGLDAAIKEKRTADMVTIGRDVLAKDPNNLLVLYQLAFGIYSTELVASPPKYDRLADAVEFVNKAMPMIEAGQAPAGSANFDKNVALAWMTQVLAINAAKAGNTEEAANLYAKSSSLAPGNVALVTRNLFAVFGFRQSEYGEAVKAFKAFPEADQQTPDAKPEVKAALDKVNTAADALVDAGAAFVGYTRAKGVAAPVREKVNATLETVYKSRHPEDASLAGLQKIVQEKEAALAGGGTAASAAPPTGD